MNQVVATALAGCPPEDWIDVDALFATMRRNIAVPIDAEARFRAGVLRLDYVLPSAGS